MNLTAVTALPAQIEWLRLLLWPMEAASSESTADNDQIWMQRVSNGEPDALQPIFDRWKKPLLNFFYRSLGSRADAEDLTLQTFNRVYRAAPRYRPEAKFSTWLFSIARHELLHELRRRKRKPVESVPPSDLVAVSADASAAERQRAVELEEQLLTALRELPERQRSALLLTANGELTHSEIAGSLGVSETNLNVILHRARQALRALFTSHK